MERLDKLLSNTGRWSRKEVKLLIRSGRVSVEDIPLVRPETKIAPEVQIKVDGEPVTCGELVYLMLHKPAGYISATEDPRKQTVLDLLPPHLRRVGLFPVGRLDKDTEGLLLLTNDGPLAHELLAPKKHVDKTYFVRVDGVLDERDEEAFAAGMILRDGLECQPAHLERLEQPNEGLVTIHEGKYHQIKRMMASQYKPVIYLKRLRMGPLVLDETLACGQWRELTQEERTALGR